jgi:hypothetical protein
MRFLPRSPRGTGLLAVVVWIGHCAAAWQMLPPQSRAVISTAGFHQPIAFSPDGRIFVTREYGADGKPSGVGFWSANSGRAIPHLPELQFDLGRCDTDLS